MSNKSNFHDLYVNRWDKFLEGERKGGVQYWSIDVAPSLTKKEPAQHGQEINVNRLNKNTGNHQPES